MIRVALLALLATGLALGCARTAPERPIIRDDSIFFRIADDERLSDLAGTLLGSRLAPHLMAEGSFTVFAPTDSAFAALPAALRERMTAGGAGAYNALAYHLVPDTVSASAFDGRALRTLHGGALRLGRNGDALTVNRVPVLDTLLASNGVVYVIGAVLRPPGAQD
jgi:uncharacterized surface protein with fasciclin (FAS1) repeats